MAVAKSSGGRLKDQVGGKGQIGSKESACIRDVDNATSSKDPEDQIVENSHSVCCLTFEATAVFTKRLIAAIMQPGLDAPVLANVFQ